MYKSYDQQIYPAKPVHASQSHSACQHNIGGKNNDGRNKLQKCSVDPFHVFNKLVEQDNSSIKDCRTQAEQYPDKIVSAAYISDTGDHHKSGRGHNKAHDLLSCKFFAEKNGTYNGNDHRSKVIA